MTNLDKFKDQRTPAYYRWITSDDPGETSLGNGESEET
jgi:hypothetical protein